MLETSLTPPAAPLDGGLWLGFTAFVLTLLLFDLFLTKRQTRALTFRQALRRTSVWIGLGLMVNLGVYRHFGAQSGLEFSTAYLLEESLSVDNLFVFLMIFRYFQVPEQHQHKVLFLGVLGAMVMRGVVIAAGISLVGRWEIVLSVFAVILIYSGIQLWRDDEDSVNPEKNWMVRMSRRIFPVTEQYHGSRLFVRLEGKLYATPLLIVVVAVETSDLIFAMDSIPAVFGVSRDNFIVFASNIMAILGLRAIYFTLAGLMRMFHYLKFGLSAILILIGARMLLRHTLVIPLPHTLAIIGLLLLVSTAASWFAPRPDEPPLAEVELDKPPGGAE